MQDAIKKAEIEAKAKQDKVGPQGPLPSAFHYITALPTKLLLRLTVHAAVQQPWAAARGLGSCVELGILRLDSRQDSPGSQHAPVL